MHDAIDALAGSKVAVDKLVADIPRRQVGCWDGRPRRFAARLDDSGKVFAFADIFYQVGCIGYVMPKGLENVPVLVSVNPTIVEGSLVKHTMAIELTQ